MMFQKCLSWVDKYDQTVRNYYYSKMSKNNFKKKARIQSLKTGISRSVLDIKRVYFNLLIVGVYNIKEYKHLQF